MTANVRVFQGRSLERYLAANAKRRVPLRETIIILLFFETVMDLWLLFHSITNVRWLVICHYYDCVVVQVTTRFQNVAVNLR